MLNGEQGGITVCEQGCSGFGDELAKSSTLFAHILILAGSDSDLQVQVKIIMSNSILNRTVLVL